MAAEPIPHDAVAAVMVLASSSLRARAVYQLDPLAMCRRGAAGHGLEARRGRPSRTDRLSRYQMPAMRFVVALLLLSREEDSLPVFGDSL